MKKNIVLIGMTGSGKTTLARLISENIRPDMKLINLDTYLEQQEGKKVRELFQIGEDYFRNLESKVVEKISNEEGLIIDSGGGVIKNPDNIKMLKKNGLIIFINRPIDEIAKDMDMNRPLLKGGIEKLYSLYNERFEIYRKSCDIELLNDKTLEDALGKLKVILNSQARK